MGQTLANSLKGLSGEDLMKTNGAIAQGISDLILMLVITLSLTTQQILPRATSLTNLLAVLVQPLLLQLLMQRKVLSVAWLRLSTLTLLS
jgi:hypothetical protein